MIFDTFKLTSEPDGTKRVYMNGEELKHVVAADVRLRVDELPLVTLQFSSPFIELRPEKRGRDRAR